MKKIILFIFSIVLITNASFGQGGTWTWISGSNTSSAPAVFGTQGIPSVNNRPPAAYEPCEWKDKNGNFWIYGGGIPNVTTYSDMWKFNPATLEWTWVKGPGVSNQAAVYGTQYVPDPANTPGRRGYGAATWVDTSGALWLFGGSLINSGVRKNDLWKYDIASNQWTWMKGSTGVDVKGVHGTQGQPGAANTPGARWETCSAWTDSANNLWLFGGQGYDENSQLGDLNDLWKYDISTGQWTWMKGSAFRNVLPSYGTKGVSNPGNDPGGRWTYNKWKDKQGNLWIHGGGKLNTATTYNDMWKYDINSGNWTWMNGSNVSGDAGNYQGNCVFDTINLPANRYEQRSGATDNCGRFWLFGGFQHNGGSNLNDLWYFDPQQVKWNWVSGTNTGNQIGNYGTIGVPSPSNMPASRMGAVAWWGNDNKFYLFGGQRGSFIYSDVWVFEPDTNCVPACQATVVLPNADFQSSNTSFCANDCITFTDLSSNATGLQWTFAGGTPSSSTLPNPQVCYLTAGIYNVTLVASNAAGRDTLSINNYITVNTSPPTPTITQVHNDTLLCSVDPSYTNYQWYNGTSPIAGATDTLLIITQSGNYNVEVTNANGCRTAVGINVVIGVQNYMKDNFASLSPNPVKDKFSIHGLPFTVHQIYIYNMPGQRIQSKQQETDNRKAETTIDVSELTSGIYFVMLIGDQERWVGRFVKE